jgi:hypothetical protein
LVSPGDFGRLPDGAAIHHTAVQNIFSGDLSHYFKHIY